MKQKITPLMICWWMVLSGLMMFGFAKIAKADTWVMANNGGGQVVLTDRLCKGYKHVYYAYTHTPRFYMDACWALMDGKVHVVYENGERRVYEMNDFVQDQVTPKKKGQPL